MASGVLFPGVDNRQGFMFYYSLVTLEQMATTNIYTTSGCMTEGNAAAIQFSIQLSMILAVIMLVLLGIPRYKWSDVKCKREKSEAAIPSASIDNPIQT